MDKCHYCNFVINLFFISIDIATHVAPTYVLHTLTWLIQNLYT
ncbi:hypothetical protein NT01EI_2961 [Edwardsiella ictaluri 93-146]|uniref:Uncharacterized protein n=1 Tax=Edwardsiella ictaluri (strain 93-146) TaxID=634503 RepID=C5B8R2_EDWI9|nr:hypothetical protein NT01EI_2961 [Edwardsiella ictaluri 93-146]